MSKVSSKKSTSQSSIFSFFHPVSQSTSSNDNNILQKTNDKRTHKEIVEDKEEMKKIEKDLAPIKKTFPPKPKNEKKSEILTKDMENNKDSLKNNNKESKKPKKKLLKKKIITDSD